MQPHSTILIKQLVKPQHFKRMEVLMIWVNLGLGRVSSNYHQRILDLLLQNKIMLKIKVTLSKEELVEDSKCDNSFPQLLILIKLLKTSDHKENSFLTQSNNLPSLVRRTLRIFWLVVKIVDKLWWTRQMKKYLTFNARVTFKLLFTISSKNLRIPCRIILNFIKT